MKKILATFLLVSVVLAGCKKEDNNGAVGTLEPAQKQRAVIFKYTATSCQFCTGGGTVRLAETMAQIREDGVAIALHSNDGLTSAIAATIYTGWSELSGTPDFAVNEHLDAGQGGMNGWAITKTQESPVAGVGHQREVNGNSITVRSKVKFYENTSGTYYLGAYLISGDVDAATPHTQTDSQGYIETTDGVSYWAQDAAGWNNGGQLDYVYKAGDKLKHEHVLSAGADGVSTWGEALPINSFSNGDNYTFNYNITIPQSAVRDGMKVVTVLWKQESNGTVWAVNAYAR